MNITAVKEKISLLYEKALNVSDTSSRAHPVRIIQASKSIIGINKDSPIEELLIFCNKYIDSFKLMNFDSDIDKSSVSEMISYKNLEEALVNCDRSAARQSSYELSRVSEGMQIVEFLLQHSFKYSKQSFFLIWSIYRMMLFLDKKFIFESLLLCVESILSSTEISKNIFLFKEDVNSFKNLSDKEFDRCSVFHQIYFSDLVRKEKIIDAMSDIATFSHSLNEKYNGIYESRMKIWSYMNEKKSDEFNCNMILDLDAIRGMMKVFEDNDVCPHGIYEYTKKYI